MTGGQDKKMSIWTRRDSSINYTHTHTHTHARARARARANQPSFLFIRNTISKWISWSAL